MLTDARAPALLAFAPFALVPKVAQGLEHVDRERESERARERERERTLLQRRLHNGESIAPPVDRQTVPTTPRAPAQQ